MKKLYLIVISIFLVGCSGSRYMDYRAMPKDINEAKIILEDLTWSQHMLWRPDNFQIADTYIGWDYGVVSDSSTRGRSTGIGVSKQFGDSGIGIGIGTVGSKSQTKMTTRDVVDRTYYRSIKDVRLVSWKRKLKQWYLVRLINDNQSKKDVLHTRSLTDAKLYIDSLSTLIQYSEDNKSIETVTIPDEIPSVQEMPQVNSMYEELIKLKELKDKGILTDNEFQIQKQKILKN